MRHPYCHSHSAWKTTSWMPWISTSRAGWSATARREVGQNKLPRFIAAGRDGNSGKSRIMADVCIHSRLHGHAVHDRSYLRFSCRKLVLSLEYCQPHITYTWPAKRIYKSCYCELQHIWCIPELHIDDPSHSLERAASIAAFHGTVWHYLTPIPTQMSQFNVSTINQHPQLKQLPQRHRGDEFPPMRAGVAVPTHHTKRSAIFRNRALASDLRESRLKAWVYIIKCGTEPETKVNTFALRFYRLIK